MPLGVSWLRSPMRACSGRPQRLVLQSIIALACRAVPSLLEAQRGERAAKLITPATRVPHAVGYLPTMVNV